MSQSLQEAICEILMKCRITIFLLIASDALFTLVAMNDNWFVLIDGQQMGPYSSEDFSQYVQEGRIRGEMLVWAEGMPEWLPAREVPGLIPQKAETAAAPTSWVPPGTRASTSITPTKSVSLSTPTSSLTHGPSAGAYPFFLTKTASFSLWLWMLLGGYLLLILGIIFIVIGSKSQAAGGDAGMAPIIGLVLIFSMPIFLVISVILFYIYLYRGWYCLQAGTPRTTPGKAIGFLFIPFFNLYWIFQAFNGFAQDWNRIVSSYDDLRDTPRMSENVFLLFCIGMFVPGLSLVMIFPMMSQLCKGINYFAYRRNPKTSTGAGMPGFGGIKFS
jgi:GYF domain 2